MTTTKNNPAIAFAALIALPALSLPAAAQNPVINEVLGSTTGSDSEYVELYGAVGTPLGGLSIIVVESDDQSNNGAIDFRIDLGADARIGDNGFFLLGNTTAAAQYGVTPNLELPANAIENSSYTIALIETDSISGTVATDSITIIDAVGVTDGETAAFFAFDAPVVGPDGTFLPAGVIRAQDGVDTDTAADWILADFNNGSPPNSPTPGTGFEPPAPGACDAGEVFIHVIQGAGPESECDGDTVTITGVVVGDYEGSSPALRGFYVQEEDADQDGDPATSEGIFVFNGNEDRVNVGDLVRVTGEVDEFQDQTQLRFPDSLDVLGSGYSVTPTDIALPLDSATALEAVEGMLVRVPQTLYVTEHFQLGRFGQVVVSAGDRLYQPTNVAMPGDDAGAVQAANDLNRLFIDDDLNAQNPDPIVLARGDTELTASNTLRGGDTATGTVGVMTYTWAGNPASGNAYRLRPFGALDGHLLFEPANPRPSSAPYVGGSLTVASFNVLNYFVSIDDGSDDCGPTQDQDCRGAQSAVEFGRQRDKLLSALAMLDADVVGLVELENTPGVSPEADIAAGLNESLGVGSYAIVDAAAGGGVVGPDTIRVGMLYKPGSVEPLGAPALLDFSIDSLGEARSRTAIAQTFVETASGEVFTAVVNHFKSKSGSEIDDGGALCSVDPAYADCDQGDGQGFFNATRTLHAQELADWLAGDPTDSGDTDFLILGDLNAYAMEDPIRTLEASGFVNLSDGPEDYSYVFDGQWGALDYVLTSQSLVSSVTGFDKYNINADEPNALDYNTNFKSDNQVEILYAPDEYRTSDHDPVVVGLGMDSGFSAAVLPRKLWPPNHWLRPVFVFGYDNRFAPLHAAITDVVSSEADSGLGRGDRPNDIVVLGERLALLRAERYSRDGRTYTITVRLTDGGQVTYADVDVLVPKRLRW